MNHSNNFIFLFVTFLLASMSMYAQEVPTDVDGLTAHPDNFTQVMQFTDKPTSAQIDSLWRMSILYYRVSSDTFTILSDHAAAITANHPNKSLQGKGLLLKGMAYIEDSISLSLLIKGRELLIEAKDLDFQSEAEKALADYYINRDEKKNAMKFNLLAIESAKKSGDSLRMAGPIMAVGGIYYGWSQFKKAAEYLGQAAAILEALKNVEQLPPLLTNQASVFRNLGDQHQAIADTISQGAALHLDSAQMYFRKGLAGATRALELSNEMNNGMGRLASLTNIAHLRNSTGEYNETIRIGQQALEEAQKRGIHFFLLEAQMNLCTAYRKLGRHREALPYALAGYNLAKKKNTPLSINRIEKQLYYIYKELGQPAKALTMLENMTNYDVEKNNKETKRAIADAETKYQTAEKERQILQKDKDILELEVSNAKIAKQRNLIMGGGSLIALFSFFGYRFNQVQKDRNDKKAFAEALIFAQEEERKRIARDLHDGIGQSLLLIKKQMETNAQATLENQQIISDTLEEVRSISRDLHPIQLEKFGLTATINDSIGKVEKSTELFISKEIHDIDNCLSPKSEIHLFRTIQETLSNIVKHAEATAAKISIKNNEDHVQVTIQDNGKGFDLEMAVVASKSLGIKTMHERISAIGGELKISKGENKGTNVEMIVPKNKG